MPFSSRNAAWQPEESRQCRVLQLLALHAISMLASATSLQYPTRKKNRERWLDAFPRDLLPQCRDRE